MLSSVVNCEVCEVTISELGKRVGTEFCKGNTDARLKMRARLPIKSLSYERKSHRLFVLNRHWSTSQTTDNVQQELPYPVLSRTVSCVYRGVHHPNRD